MAFDESATPTGKKREPYADFFDEYAPDKTTATAEPYADFFKEYTPEPSLWDKTKATASAITEGVSESWPEAKAQAAAAWEAGRPLDETNWADRLQEEAKAKMEAIPNQPGAGMPTLGGVSKGQFKQEVMQNFPQTASNLLGMAAGVGAGALTGAATGAPLGPWGVAGSALAGGAASLIPMYNTVKTQQARNILQNENTQRANRGMPAMTRPEALAKQEEIQPDIAHQAAWEVGTEAPGLLAEVVPWAAPWVKAGAGPLVRSALSRAGIKEFAKRGLTGMGVAAATEPVEEAVSNIGERAIENKYAPPGQQQPELGWNAADFGQSLAEVTGPTLRGMSPMILLGGLGAGGSGLAAGRHTYNQVQALTGVGTEDPHEALTALQQRITQPFNTAEEAVSASTLLSGMTGNRHEAEPNRYDPNLFMVSPMEPMDLKEKDAVHQQAFLGSLATQQSSPDVAATRQNPGPDTPEDRNLDTTPLQTNIESIPSTLTIDGPNGPFETTPAQWLKGYNDAVSIAANTHAQPEMRQKAAERAAGMFAADRAQGHNLLPEPAQPGAKPKKAKQPRQVRSDNAQPNPIIRPPGQQGSLGAKTEPLPVSEEKPVAVAQGTHSPSDTPVPGAAVELDNTRHPAPALPLDETPNREDTHAQPLPRTGGMPKPGTPVKVPDALRTDSQAGGAGGRPEQADSATGTPDVPHDATLDAIGGEPPLRPQGTGGVKPSAQPGKTVHVAPTPKPVTEPVAGNQPAVAEASAHQAPPTQTAGSGVSPVIEGNANKAGIHPAPARPGASPRQKRYAFNLKSEAQGDNWHYQVTADADGKTGSLTVNSGKEHTSTSVGHFDGGVPNHSIHHVVKPAKVSLGPDGLVTGVITKGVVQTADRDGNLDPIQEPEVGAAVGAAVGAGSGPSGPQPAPKQEQGNEAITEHTTQKGHVIKGVVRKGLNQQEAVAIDPMTFKKDGGWFIREKHALSKRIGNREVQNNKFITPRILNIYRRWRDGGGELVDGADGSGGYTMDSDAQNEALMEFGNLKTSGQARSSGGQKQVETVEYFKKEDLEEALKGKTKQPATAQGPVTPPVAAEPAPTVEPAQPTVTEKPASLKAKPPKIDASKDSILTAIAKVGGLDRREAGRQGIDPAFFSKRGHLIYRVFSANNGLTFDDMAHSVLAPAGYPVSGANDLLDAVTRELHGTKVYTPTGDEWSAQNQDKARSDDQAQQESEKNAAELLSLSTAADEETVDLGVLRLEAEKYADENALDALMESDKTDAEIQSTLEGIIANGRQSKESQPNGETLEGEKKAGTTEVAGQAGDAGTTETDEQWYRQAKAQQLKNQEDGLPLAGDMDAADFDGLTRNQQGNSGNVKFIDPLGHEVAIAQRTGHGFDNKWHGDWTINFTNRTGTGTATFKDGKSALTGLSMSGNTVISNQHIKNAWFDMHMPKNEKSAIPEAETDLFGNPVGAGSKPAQKAAEADLFGEPTAQEKAENDRLKLEEAKKEKARNLNATGQGAAGGLFEQDNRQSEISNEDSDTETKYTGPIEFNKDRQNRLRNSDEEKIKQNKQFVSEEDINNSGNNHVKRNKDLLKNLYSERNFSLADINQLVSDFSIEIDTHAIIIQSGRDFNPDHTKGQFKSNRDRIRLAIKEYYWLDEDLVNPTNKPIPTKKKVDNEPSTRGSVERDRQDHAVKDGLGATAIRQESGAATGDTGRTGEAVGEERQRAAGGGGLPATSPVVGGERGDQPMDSATGQFRLERGFARGAERQRGAIAGSAGVAAEPDGNEAAKGAVGGTVASSPDEAATRRNPGEAVLTQERGNEQNPQQAEPIPDETLDDFIESTHNEAKIKAQQAAESIKVIPNDRANIDATLPVLTEGQREDVHFAETRWDKPDGYGVLFANGTGTGKTYVGLGAIKRSVQQGKGNILIVVPSDAIAQGWIRSGKDLNLDIQALLDTKTVGKGVVITTFANLGTNDALAGREWDMVVADEAHYLMNSAQATETAALNRLRAISYHPMGVDDRAEMLNRPLFDDWSRAQKNAGRSRANQDTMDEILHSDQAEEKRLDAEWNAHVKTVKADIEAHQGQGRTRALFLSATPFAYEKNVKWGEGYLFDFPPRSNIRRYNEATGFEKFMVQHFGYRTRYNKLTEPDANVDRDIMQRNFNTWMRREGKMSTRMLDVDFDYERRFILVDDAVGQKIDQGLEFLSQGENGRYRQLANILWERFDYLARSRLLQAIKVRAAIPIIHAHHALGRKVVVFYDLNEGGGSNVFNFSDLLESEISVSGIPVKGQGEHISYDKLETETVALSDLAKEFRALKPDLWRLDFSAYVSPLQALTQAFPEAGINNGTEPKKKRMKAIDNFNDDSQPQANLLVVQKALNAGWSGHDTTGKHQRVILNLGQPTAPIESIQQEGRIYRVGQASNAIFQYLNTGTNWERYAFATRIARRAATAENLAMGEQARGLREAFIQAFEDSTADYAPEVGEGTGGKEADRAMVTALTDWDRAKTMYFAQQKKTSRNKAQEGADYFATPEPLGVKMVEWADIRPNENVLEPSAGHGAIARFLPSNAKQKLIEPSPELASRAALATGQEIIQERFEDHYIGNKYDAVIMNPPFGTAGKTAMEHVEKAFGHLRDGGRVVAIIPRGPAMDKRFEQWISTPTEKTVKTEPLSVTWQGNKIYVGDTIVFMGYPSPNSNKGYGPMKGVVAGKAFGSSNIFIRAEIGGEQSIDVSLLDSIQPTGKRSTKVTVPNEAYLVASIDLPPSTFGRAGTQVSARVVIIERHEDAADATIPQQNLDLSNAADIGELFNRLEHLDIPKRNLPESDTGNGMFVIAETVHSQTKAPLFVATLAEKVNREEYDRVNAIAKKHGGYWSKYAQQGAIPGFQFKSAEGRVAFVREAAGGAVSEGDLTVRYSVAGWHGSPAAFDKNRGLPFKGMSQQAAQAVVDRYRAGLKVPALKIEVFATQDAAGLGANRQPIEAEFHIPTNTLRVIAGNHQNPAHLLATLREEIVGHYGLRNLLGADHGGVMNEVEKAAKANPAFRAEWIKLSGRDPRTGAIVNRNAPYFSEGANYDKAEIADEVISKMARAGVENGWMARIVDLITRLLRKIGVIRGPMGRQEMLALLARAERGLKGSIKESLTVGEGVRASFGGKAASMGAGLEPAPTDRNAAGKLLAPNGEVSKLNEVQWRQVRSEPFIKWFGDWINDPANASKMVDENGEPKVVHHGGYADITAFNKRYRGATTGTSDSEKAFFFAGSKIDAALYSSMVEQEDEDNQSDIYDVYLSLKNPLMLGLTDESNLGEDLFNELSEDDTVALSYAEDEGYDGVLWPNGSWGNSAYTAAVFEPTQIKSATGNAGAFAPTSPDIRYSKSSAPVGVFAADDLFKDIDNATRESQAGQLKRKGFQWWNELKGKAKRQALGTLTGLQLVEISQQMLPSVKDYAKFASMMESYRHKIMVGDRHAPGEVDRLGAAGIVKLHTALGEVEMNRLAEVQHQATLYGLTPAEGFTVLTDAKEAAKEIAKLRRLRESASGGTPSYKKGPDWNLGKPLPGVRSQANLLEEEKGWLRKLAFEKTRARENERVQAMYDALTPEAKRVYVLERDSHLSMSHKIEEALVLMIEDGPLVRDQKDSSIKQLRHDFESQRVSGDYFPLYRNGEFWVYLKGQMMPSEGPRVTIEVLNAQQAKVTSVHGFNQQDKAYLKNLGGTFRKAKGQPGFFLLPSDQVWRVEDSWKDKLEDQGPKEGDREFVLFHTEEERKAFIKKAEAQGREVKGTGKKLEGLRDMEGVSAEFVGKVEDLLSQLGTGPEVAAVQDQVWQMYLQSLPELSSRKHMIHRNKTPGFGQDSLLAYANKMSHDAYGYARLKTGPELRHVLADLKGDIEAAGSPGKADYAKVRLGLLRSFKRDVLDAGMDDAFVRQMATHLDTEENKATAEGKAAAKQWADYAAIVGKWKNREQATRKVEEEMARLAKRLVAVGRINADDNGHEFASNVYGELQQAYGHLMQPSSSGLVVNMNQLGYVYAMALSPSAWIVNTFQTPVKSMPFVAAKFGIGPTTKAFTAAYGLVFKGSAEKKAGAAAEGVPLDSINPKNAVFGNAMEVFGIRHLLKGEEAELYRIAEDTGRIDNTRAHDLWGFAEEGQQRGQAGQKWSEATMFGFHETERINREVSLLASFRVARESGMGYEDSVDYALSVIDKTHLDYSAKNRARMMRGDLARVALQFKSYSQGMMFLWLRSAYQAFWNKNTTAEERREARKYLMLQAGVQISFAGVMGLPIGALWFIAQAALTGPDDDPDDWEADFRQAMADWLGVTGGRGMSKGLLNMTGPADLHSRLSERDLLWRDQDKDLEGKDWLSNAIYNTAGPSIGVLGNIMDGLKLMGEGHWQRGIEKTMPKFVAAPMKAVRYATEGAKTLKGDTLIEDVGLSEIVAQAVGFVPSRLSERYEENTATKQIESRLHERRQELLDNAREAMMARDSEAMKEANAEIARWNGLNREKAIKRQDIMASAKTFAKNRRMAVDGMVLDRKLRGRLDRKYEFAQ